LANTEIWHEITIKASPRDVYQALTDLEKLAQWWIPDTRGESSIGKTLEFRIGDLCQEMQVMLLQPNERVGWQPTETGLPDWTGTRVAFTIAPQETDDRASVQFRHSGYREDIAAFGVYSMSWAIRLISLKDLLEKGTGHPFPNEWDS